MASNTDFNTIQSSIKSHTNNNLTNYALFTSGLNVTNEVLANYDPLKTGYGRLFMVRKPLFLQESIPNKLNKFKHILEYGNTSVTGLGDYTVQFQDMTGGYAGRKFEVPTGVQDGTDTITVKVYEFSGSPVRETIHSWINGSIDILSGLTHYNGVEADDVPRLQSNQTAEFIYVATDSTGESIEYACLLANCFPDSIKNSHFDYNSGEHNIVEYDINFHCSKYESIQINKVAAALLKRYKLLANSLNFYSGITISDDTLGAGFGYNYETGKLDSNAKNMSNKPIS